MKTKSPSFELVLPVAKKNNVPLHNQFHRNGIASAVQGVCWLALAGLQLNKEKAALKHGEWEGWAEKNCEFTLRTAQRYMALADGVKARALKNDSGVVFRLLEKAPDELTDKQRQDLLAAVQKLTDGETVAELYEDFGITKKKSAAGLKGGKRKHTPRGEDVNDAAEVARDLWEEHIKFLEEDGLETRSWKDLPTVELDRLRSAIADLGRLLKKGK